MIDTLWIFSTKNVRRNASSILCTTHPYLSALISLIIIYDFFGFKFRINLSQAASTLVTYDTVVFGFTATAIALAIAIPNPTFIRFLSAQKNGSTPFRDFLFILVWNGFIHIFSFFLLIPIVLIGSEWIFVPRTSSGFMHLYVFILIWAHLYSAFQFLVTTLGVYELGDLYAMYVAKERNSEEDAH